MRLFSSLVLLAVLALFALPAAAGPLPYLAGGATLRTGQYLVSANNAFYLIMQEDGNLCEYVGSGPGNQGEKVWCSGSSGSYGHFVAFLGRDGTLCVGMGDYPGGGKSLWCNKQRTAPGTPTALLLNDNAEIYIGIGKPEKLETLLWRTGIHYAQVSLTPPAEGGIKWQDGQVCPGTCSKMLRVGSAQAFTAITPTAKNSVFRDWTGVACMGPVASVCWAKILEQVPQMVIDQIQYTYDPYQATPIGVRYFPTVTIATMLKAGAPLVIMYGQQGTAVLFDPYPVNPRWIVDPDGPLRLASNPNLCLSAGLTNTTQRAAFQQLMGFPDPAALELDACTLMAPAQYWKTSTVNLPFGSYTVLRPVTGGCLQVANSEGRIYPSVTTSCIWDNAKVMLDQANLASHKPEFDSQGFKLTP